MDEVAKMMEEDRRLEEQKHYEADGPSTPIRGSPRTSIHLMPDHSAQQSGASIQLQHTMPSGDTNTNCDEVNI